MERILTFLSSHTRALSLALVLLSLTIATFQFITTKTTALTNWKGGGFGMYTEPHYDARSVWLIVQDGAGAVRLWPAEDDLVAWRDGVSLRGGYVIQNIMTQAAQLRYYPQDAAAGRLLKDAQSMRWMSDLVDGATPAKGAAFAANELKIVVSERTYDMWARTVSPQIVFEYGGVK